MSLQPEAWEDLLASGQVLPPNGEGDVVDERPEDFSVDASGRLATMRDEER